MALRMIGSTEFTIYVSPFDRLYRNLTVPDATKSYELSGWVLLNEVKKVEVFCLTIELVFVPDLPR